MKNLSYIWQLISSMEDAAQRLESLPKGKQNLEITKLNALLFDLHERVKEEVDKHGQ